MLAFVLGTGPVATAAVTATGSISGRVENSMSGQGLNNVRVKVKHTGIEAFTDQTGTYPHRVGG